MSNNARLEWRCRRGTKELDLLLQTWLRQEFDLSAEADRQAFLELLEWSDDELTHLLLGTHQSDQTRINELARKIRSLSLHLT